MALSGGLWLLMLARGNPSRRHCMPFHGPPGQKKQMDSRCVEKPHVGRGKVDRFRGPFDRKISLQLGHALRAARGIYYRYPRKSMPKTRAPKPPKIGPPRMTGADLKFTREQMGLSQSQLAEALGIERGKSTI